MSHFRLYNIKNKIFHIVQGILNVVFFFAKSIISFPSSWFSFHLGGNIFVFSTVLKKLFSLHIRSMWETICDALHIPVARILGSKFLECPHSSISGMLVWNTTTLSPPHPKMQIWTDLGTLGWVRLDPTPGMQIWTDLGTLGWVGLDHPPPLPLKMQIWTDLGTLGWVGLDHPPPPSFGERVCGDQLLYPPWIPSSLIGRTITTGWESPFMCRGVDLTSPHLCYCCFPLYRRRLWF